MLGALDLSGIQSQ